MRDIKYRVWQGGRFYYWGFIGDSFINPICENSREPLSIDEFHKRSQQYTGLKDSQGKEIYDGDIVSFDGRMTADNTLGLEPNGYFYDENSKHIVLWNNELAAWDLNFQKDDYWKYKRDTRGLFCQGDCEVIGNIYENPELLEVK